MTVFLEISEYGVDPFAGGEVDGMHLQRARECVDVVYTCACIYVYVHVYLCPCLCLCLCVCLRMCVLCVLRVCNACAYLY